MLYYLTSHGVPPWMHKLQRSEPISLNEMTVFLLHYEAWPKFCVSENWIQVRLQFIIW